MAEQVTDWQHSHDPDTTVLEAPKGAIRCDVVLIGAGAGVTSAHGAPGEWRSGTLVSKVDLPVQIPGRSLANPAAPTVVGSLSAPGGSGTRSGNWGNNARPDAYTAFGQTFDVRDYGSRVIGDGGINGSSQTEKRGGAGGVWWRWWTQDKIERLHVGDRLVQDVRLGDTLVRSVYAGSTLVYGEES